MRSSLYMLAASAGSALAAVRGFNYASQGEQNANTVELEPQSLTVSQARPSLPLRLSSSQRLVLRVQTTTPVLVCKQTRSFFHLEEDSDTINSYTMIQDGTANTVISAIPAAIATNTTLLLGLWASEDQAAFDNELTALRNAISQYGSAFTDLVTGISVGSEDLYRITPTGIENNSGVGQSPDVLVSYIQQVRQAISGGPLAAAPVGHVDTWNAYTNSSNSEVISNCDFLGLDEYPYFQNTDVNSIGNASYLFFEAYNRVEAVANGKPLWITEAGWPTSGPTQNLAVASVDNAETFWQDVACELERRNINTWWYILIDSGASPSFGVQGQLNGAPLYDLSCSASSSSSSSAAA